MDVRNYLIERLPDRLQKSVRIFSRFREWTEIRIRLGAPAAVVCPDGNVLLGERGSLRRGETPKPCETNDLAETIANLCEGSGYRYFDTLTDGFVTLDCGIRIAVAGERAGSSARLPETVTSLNIRLPGFIDTASDGFLEIIAEKPLSSALILSPPGGGKTTFLRALSKRLAKGFKERAPYRVAVVDERRELFPALADRGGCDVISGLPKAAGIERAVRLFSPQVLICDEIGGAGESAAMEAAGNCGVVFFASCHGENPEEAERKPGIRELLHSGIFHGIVTLRALPGKKTKIETRYIAL